MLIAIVPSVIGFILIFVAFRNSSRPGLITLGVSYVSVLLFIIMYANSVTCYPLLHACHDSCKHNCRCTQGIACPYTVHGTYVYSYVQMASCVQRGPRSCVCQPCVDCCLMSSLHTCSRTTQLGPLTMCLALSSYSCSFSM